MVRAGTESSRVTDPRVISRLASLCRGPAREGELGGAAQEVGQLPTPEDFANVEGKGVQGSGGRGCTPSGVGGRAHAWEPPVGGGAVALSGHEVPRSGVVPSPRGAGGLVCLKPRGGCLRPRGFCVCFFARLALIRTARKTAVARTLAINKGLRKD